MEKRKGERQPRLPTVPALSGTFVQAEEAEIMKVVAEWHAERAAMLTSEYSNQCFRAAAPGISATSAAPA
jgi:hypothetical protein